MLTCLPKPPPSLPPFSFSLLSLPSRYNGFCKGVLWPILHNCTSVYSSRQGQDGDPSDKDGSDPATEGQFSEYTMDDISHGPVHGDGGKEAALWKAYTAVNRKFADTIIQCFNEGDLIWIHGFHLLILPSFLTRRIPMAKIGLFLHTPFPSSEIFRTSTRTRAHRTKIPRDAPPPLRT